MSRDQRPVRPAIINSGGNKAGADAPARRRDDAPASGSADNPAAEPAGKSSGGGWLNKAILLLAALVGGVLVAMFAPQAKAAGFAAQLADMPITVGPLLWSEKQDAKDRQSRRWNAARQAIARRRGAEAIGWLDVMVSDEPDLGLVPVFRLARGSAALLAGHEDTAAMLLDNPALMRNGEACGWRLMAIAPDHPDALETANCAIPAIRARSATESKPMRLAGAQILLANGQHARALRWLSRLAENDPEANLIRGQAMLAHSERLTDAKPKQGWQQRGLLRLARAEASGEGETLHAARLEQAIAMQRLGKITPEKAISRAEAVAFRWRGGPLEWRALETAAGFAQLARKDAVWLRLSALRLRCGPADPKAKLLSEAVGAHLAALASPESKVPLARLSGTLWAYRDLLPADGRGIAAFEMLVARLEESRIHAKAADLLDWRRRQLPRDIERGPLSLRIARARLLAKQPERALAVLRADAAIPFPEAIARERQRLEAIALWHSGAKDAAFALLADLDGGVTLANEMRWQAKDWEGWLAADGAADAPSGEARLLRRAVALAMTGDDDALAVLHRSARGRFAPGPARDAFDALAGPDAPTDPAALRVALARLPLPDLPADSAELLAVN